MQLSNILPSIHPHQHFHEYGTYTSTIGIELVPRKAIQCEKGNNSQLKAINRQLYGHMEKKIMNKKMKTDQTCVIREMKIKATSFFTNIICKV